jgi:hypothetical protein
MDNSQICKELYKATKLPNVLISIIYFYVRRYIEKYKTTINCFYKNYLFGLDNITILEKSLYISSAQCRIIFVYDTDTYELLHIIEDIWSFSTTINRHIEKYLEAKSDDSDCVFVPASKNYSGYCPTNVNKFKNFWSESSNIETYSSDYKIVFNKLHNDIKVFNKKSDTLMHNFRYRQNRNMNCDHDIKYKNIIVYNNILYIIGYELYKLFLGGNNFVESYIDLYDLSTFNFIREFDKSSDLSAITFLNNPKYIAFKDNTIFISNYSGSKIDVWIKEECL